MKRKMDKILKKSIEKAADDYAAMAIATFVNGDFSRHAIADAFEAGAKWRVNSVWHDGTASCEAGRKALVLFDNGNANVYKDLRVLSVERLWGYVDKFAYLDDLLPDGGNEGV